MRKTSDFNFKDLGLRKTPIRVAILETFKKASKPIDVSFIISTLSKMRIKTDPATVFRTMNIFKNKGIINQIEFQEGKARYELSSLGDHHHLICENCGSVEDISNCLIPTLEKEIKEKRKFQVKKHTLEFFGLCNKCNHE